MTVWDEVRLAIIRLRDEQPDALVSFPSLEGKADRTPPFNIRLAPWAAETAKRLRRDFGDDIQITVGLFPYPLNPQEEHGTAPGNPPKLLDAGQVTVELDQPAIVRSGHTFHSLLKVSNHTSNELQISTNGHLAAAVVDPRTGEVVGGYTGAQQLKRKVYIASPDGNVQIPLAINTVSRTPRLGFAVPEGEWGFQAVLRLGSSSPDAALRLTPILPLKIIP